MRLPPFLLSLLGGRCSEPAPAGGSAALRRSRLQRAASTGITRPSTGRARPIAHPAPPLVRDRLGVPAQAAATCGPRLAWIRGCRSGSISNFRGSISKMFGVRSSGRVLPAACVDPRPLWCARLPPPGAHRPSLSEAILFTAVPHLGPAGRISPCGQAWCDAVLQRINAGTGHSSRW